MINEWFILFDAVLRWDGVSFATSRELPWTDHVPVALDDVNAPRVVVQLFALLRHFILSRDQRDRYDRSLSGMPPKRSSNSPTKRPSKRIRSSIGQTDASTAAYDTGSARLISAHHLAEHSGGGATYLSVRETLRKVEPLKEASLQQAAQAIFEIIRFRGKDSVTTNSVGWDPNRETTNQSETLALQQSVRSLPEETANRLLSAVLRLSYQALQLPNDPGVSVLAIAAIFFGSRITRLSLSSLSAPTVLLNRIPQCTSLVSLDLSHSPTLRDNVLSKILTQLPLLETINLKACLKVGDESIKALAQASGSTLRVANLSFTAVANKGLAALLASCPSLEVLKLEAVGNLVRSISSDTSDYDLG